MESIKPNTNPDAQLASLADKALIAEVLQNWGLWRDLCDWSALKTVYAPEATMQTTWFDGPALDFVAATERLSGGPSRAQHYIGTPCIAVNGARAVAQTRITILVRGPLDGVEVDATCYGWFIDRMVKLDGQWLIQTRVPVYEKDTLCAVDPAVTLALDPERLARHPATYKFMAYMQSLAGATVNTGLPQPGSAEHQQLLADCATWLAAA
ncbi:MAG: nuclear transport factor 2 family protein [Pseudomonadota bacterium]